MRSRDRGASRVGRDADEAYCDEGPCGLGNSRETMIDMHEMLVMAAVVVLTAGIAIGGAAATKGRLLPGRGRAKILRPKVWGYGTLLGQAGMGVFLFLGPLNGSRNTAFIPFAIAGAVAFMAGLHVQRRAQSPGRADDAT